MAIGVINWSQTAASNATADTSIDWREGMPPSGVNDSGRAMMASVAKYRDDNSGLLLTAGNAIAYTVATNQGYALTPGISITFTPNNTNGATATTLNVDGLGAKPLRSAPNAELPIGTIIAGTPYSATYFASNSGEWILHGLYGNPYGIELGGLLFTTVATPPNSSFVLPYGQAISRVTYATYFNAVGTLYGIGDGTTTFNVIDLRGYLIGCQDNMGGSTAGRITLAGSGIVGTTINASGGSETVSILQTNLPSVNFINSGITAATSNGGQTAIGLKTNGASSGPGSSSAQGSADGATGSLIADPAISVSITAQGVSSSGGSNTPVRNMPPTKILPCHLRII